MQSPQGQLPGRGNRLTERLILKPLLIATGKACEVTSGGSRRTSSQGGRFSDRGSRPERRVPGDTKISPGVKWAHLVSFRSAEPSWAQGRDVKSATSLEKHLSTPTLARMQTANQNFRQGKKRPETTGGGGMSGRGGKAKGVPKFPPCGMVSTRRASGRAGRNSATVGRPLWESREGVVDKRNLRTAVERPGHRRHISKEDTGKRSDYSPVRRPPKSRGHRRVSR